MWWRDVDRDPGLVVELRVVSPSYLDYLFCGDIEQNLELVVELAVVSLLYLDEPLCGGRTMTGTLDLL